MGFGGEGGVVVVVDDILDARDVVDGFAVAGEEQAHASFFAGVVV